MKNILVIMTDQHHAAALGCMGHYLVKTPHLDALAAEGTRFTSAFTVAPLCLPSRNCFLSGVYPHATQVYDNNEDVRRREDLPQMSTVFRDRGYHVGITGKYHLGNLPAPDFAVRMPDDAYANFLTARGKVWAANYWGPSFETHPSPTISCSVSPLEEDETRTAFEADEAMRFITECPRDQPFFLWANFDAPHGPYHLCEKYATMYNPDEIQLKEFHGYDRLPPEQQGWLKTRAYDQLSDDDLKKTLAYYYGAITEVDDHVGRIIAFLKEQNLYEETIILFLADHGDHAGDHRLINKSFAYDSTLRVPLLMRVPGGLPPMVRDEIVQSIDIFPTLCDLTGTEKPALLQGVSFAPLLTKVEEAGDFVARTFALTEESHYRTIRTRTHKLVYASPTARWDGGKSFTSQLYDLVADPDEWTNQYENPDYREVRAELIEKLLGATCASELPQAAYVQKITVAEHTETYGPNYQKSVAKQAAARGDITEPFTDGVYLRSLKGGDWAGGG